MNTTVSSLINYCPSINLNDTIAEFAISLWSKSLSNLQSCASGGGNGLGFTYFRPDEGAALLPYVLVIAQIFLHVPTCVVRVARWERIQAFSLLLAGVNIAITIQAYVSTQLRPEEVLVWTPVTLILDAGAMLQIYVLIIEDISFHKFFRTLTRGIANPFKAIYARLQARLRRGYRGVESTSLAGQWH
jgi:hypothetical protein